MNRSAAVLFLTAMLPPLFAQRPEHASLHVTARIEGSIRIVFKAGQTLERTASGSSSASFDVPSVGGSFSPNPAVTADGDGSIAISSPFEITVMKANLPSASYSLKARLVIPDSAHSWSIDGIDISQGSQQEIAPIEPYGRPVPHSLLVRNPGGAAPSIGFNQIHFQIIAN